MLQDKRRAAQHAQPHCARALHGTRRRLPTRQNQRQRRLSRTVGADDGNVFADLEFQADFAQRVLLRVRVAEPHPVQSHRYRPDRGAGRLVRSVEFVHVRNVAHPVQQARKRPPTDQRREHHPVGDIAEHQPRPVMQPEFEAPLHVGAEPLQVHPGEECDNTVDVGRHHLKDQMPQPIQHRQHADRGGRDGDSGNKGRGEHRRGAPAPAFDESGQPTDIRTVDDGQKTAQSRDEEGDHSGSKRRGEQHSQPVTVGQQPHRHRAQQCQPLGKRNHPGDDRDHRAERPHDRRLCQLGRL